MPSASEGRLAHILQRGMLIVGAQTDYAPWGMLDTNGRIIGLRPDLALADRMGVGLELVSLTASNRVLRLAQGVFDVEIAAMGDTVT